MKKYPRLSEMGVQHPDQISRFSVSSLDFTDFLRIVYDRPEGSLLPVSRTYRFPRIQKKLKGDDRQGEVVMESSPAFHEAVDELHKIVGLRKSKVEIAKTMLDELRCLEEDFTSHSEMLKEMIAKIKES